MVLIEQISALIDYLENHQDLALGHCSRTNEGRSVMKRYWMECAQILNAVSVNCPNKTPAEWRTFYNEYKSKMLKKIKSQKSEMSATGGGPAKKMILTPLQERLHTILGRDVGEPLPGARHNPLTPTITVPSVDASPTTSPLNNSLSLLDNYDVPMPDVVVENELVETVPPQEISLDQENFVQPSTSNQPPKRRTSTRRYAAEDTAGHAALEAVQSRLEAIVARNAEATLKNAEAINNLAAAINRQSCSTEKVVKLLDRFVTSVSEKGDDSLSPEPEDVENEIKVFCPECNSEVPHSAKGIQLDQTKILIAKVYHYFEREYEELKKTITGIDQTPLAKFRQRTALATGVSETMVLEILEEEARRNDERRETLQEQSQARKRPRQADSSSEDDSDENDDGGDEQPAADDEERETLVVKEEPPEPDNEEPEVYVDLPNVKKEPGASGDSRELADPISIDLKQEPQKEEVTTSTESQAVQSATKSSKIRKTQRKTTKKNTDTSPATYAPPDGPPAASALLGTSALPGTSAPPTTSAPTRRQLLLLDDGEVKVEQIETGEDGFS